MNAQTLRSAIGGPNALSRWSLVALLPLGLLAGTLWGLRNGMTLWPWLPVVASIQLFLILPFWICRAILLRANAKGPRPLLGLAMFAFLGGLRAVLIVYVGTLMGVQIPTESLADYLPNGIGTGITILGVVAIVVDGSRNHQAAVQHLAELDAEIERTLTFDEAELIAVEARSIEKITLMLEQELLAVQPESEHNPPRVAASLRRIASDIVRPLSHDIASSEEWMPAGKDIKVKLPRWERIKAVVADMRPANPIVPFLLIELIALPSAFSERVGGVVFAAVNVLLGGLIMLVLSWALERFWPTGRTTIVRVLILGASYAAIGILAAWVMLTTTRAIVGVENPLWITPFFLVVTSIGVSVRASLSIQNRAMEERMAHSIAQNAQLNARVRELSRQAQNRIAKFLHSGVQAELIASAMALSARVADSDVTGSSKDQAQRELARLTASISQRMVPKEMDELSARTKVLDLTSLWSGVISVEVDVDDHVWSVLDEDRQALTAVNDVIAEGLTNAVRHGQGSQIKVDMSIEGADVIVRITSSGSIAATSQAGLGSAFMTEVTRNWELTTKDGFVYLTAKIPLSHLVA
jgi:signal transduction histidine kinase